MSNRCNRNILNAVPTVVEGATVTLAVTTTPAITPEFGQCLSFRVSPALDPVTGQEVTTLTIGTTTGQIVDNCGETLPAQMIADAMCCDKCNVFTVQFGVQGTKTVFFARRGFARRKTRTVAP